MSYFWLTLVVQFAGLLLTFNVIARSIYDCQSKTVSVTLGLEYNTWTSW